MRVQKDGGKVKMPGALLQLIKKPTAKKITESHRNTVAEGLDE